MKSESIKFKLDNENEYLKLDYLVLAGAKLSELIKKKRYTKIVNFYGTTEIIFATTKISHGY